MKFSLITVGRLKEKEFAALSDEYLKRMRGAVTVKEIDIRKNLSGPQLQEAECAEILSSIPAGSKIIVCDERGKNISSVELASQFKQWQSPSITFIIGGADGVNDAVRSKADLILSFGRLTWPHRLARVMLLEQIYRAQTIMDGHPYHRE